MENTQEVFSDYRYIIDDLSHLAVGSRYRYEELMDNIDLSYKYRCIIKRFLLREVDPSITIESHFYCMTADSESYEIYRQLQTKVRCYVKSHKKRLFGSQRYEERFMPLEELVAMSVEEKRSRRLLIAEIQMTKMRLMNYAF